MKHRQIPVRAAASRRRDMCGLEKKKHNPPPHTHRVCPFRPVMNALSSPCYAARDVWSVTSSLTRGSQRHLKKV